MKGVRNILLGKCKLQLKVHQQSWKEKLCQRGKRPLESLPKAQKSLALWNLRRRKRHPRVPSRLQSTPETRKKTWLAQLMGNRNKSLQHHWGRGHSTKELEILQNWKYFSSKTPKRRRRKAARFRDGETRCNKRVRAELMLCTLDQLLCLKTDNVISGLGLQIFSDWINKAKLWFVFVNFIGNWCYFNPTF